MLFSTKSADDQQYNYIIDELISGESKEPFIKASLQALYDLVKKELLAKSANETHLAHFENIFSDRTVSITSLNIKSLQCAILFTIIARDLGEKKVPSFVGADYFLNNIGESWYPKFRSQDFEWDSYDKLLPIVCFHDDYQVKLKDLCISDETKLEGAPIVTPLNLSLADLNRTLANDIYLVGFTTNYLHVDGRNMSPLEFFMHDLAHKTIRQKELGTSSITRKNVKHFLDSAQYRNLTEEERYMCDYWIFLITHETEYVFAVLRQEEFFLTTKIGEDKHITKILGRVEAQDYTTEPFLNHFSSRSFYSFYKELLPDALQFKGIKRTYSEQDSVHIAEIQKWLLDSWNVFQTEWNKSIDSENEANATFNANFANLARHRPTPIVHANSKIINNAARWNHRKKGGQRRTIRKKKSKRKLYSRRR